MRIPNGQFGRTTEHTVDQSSVNLTNNSRALRGNVGKRTPAKDHRLTFLGRLKTSVSKFINQELDTILIFDNRQFFARRSNTDVIGVVTRLRDFQKQARYSLITPG